MRHHNNKRKFGTSVGTGGFTARACAILERVKIIAIQIDKTINLNFILYYLI
jgi:hypothetical protein